MSTTRVFKQKWCTFGDLFCFRSREICLGTGNQTLHWHIHSDLRTPKKRFSKMDIDLLQTEDSFLLRSIPLSEFANFSSVFLFTFCIYEVARINGYFYGTVKNDPASHPVIQRSKIPRWSPKMSEIRRCFQLLYLLEGPAIWLIWMEYPTTTDWLCSVPFRSFLVHYILYLLWPLLFFRWRRFDLAAIDSVLVWLTLDFTIYTFWQINYWASWLLYPYLWYITFATCY